ncbi:MAG: MerR family transcriptional regulator [Candidatus Planktophila sp.]|nr:MerR family transcriptional regulator [Candidatus Planktophila sp.]MBP7805945.1 MerR family transcriptional regulator [Candidatus Planktophila sp.]
MEELLTVAAVARRLGVAPATLRTWARRYGIGPSEHESGSHRRYCPEDLAKLTTMRRLIIAGMSPGEAAEKALSTKSAIKMEKIVGGFSDRPDVIDALHSAANALDKNFIESTLRNDIEKHGVIHSWQEVIVPVLVMLGKSWEETGEGIEIEHFFSETLKRILRERSSMIQKPINPRPVLVASVGEEMHSLAIHALTAALAERNIECHFLGARTPFAALEAMVEKFAPPAIFLWAQLVENGDPSFFKNLPAVRPAPRILLGGPGWRESDCANMTQTPDLNFACEEITRAIGA